MKPTNLVQSCATLGALGGAGLVLADRVRRHRQQRGADHSVAIRLLVPLVRWEANLALTGRLRQPNRPEAGRFTHADVDHLLNDAWGRYNAVAPEMPTQPTAGSRMNVRLATLTLGLFQSLLTASVERRYAIELVSNVTRRIYKQWGLVGRALGRTMLARLAKPVGSAADLARRTRPDGTVALRFPFNPPGYMAKRVSVGDAIAFDMVRCPVAAVFRAQGAVDLCRSSWCDLDYPLAEPQGLTLQRTKTLVEGDDHCNFRLMAADAPTTIASALPADASDPLGARVR